MLKRKKGIAILLAILVVLLAVFAKHVLDTRRIEAFNQEVMAQVDRLDQTFHSSDRNVQLETLHKLTELQTSSSENKDTQSATLETIEERITSYKKELSQVYQSKLDELSTDVSTLEEVRQQRDHITQLQSLMEEEKSYQLLTDEDYKTFAEKLTALTEKGKQKETEIKEAEEKKKQEEAKAAEEQKKQAEIRLKPSTGEGASNTQAQQGGTQAAPSNPSSSQGGSDPVYRWFGPNGGYITHHADGSYTVTDPNGNVSNGDPGGW